MADISQDCLRKFVTVYACQLSTLGQKYFKSLEIGSDCSKTILFQLELAIALLDCICNIDLETEECLTNIQVQAILEDLKFVLATLQKCNCG